MAGATSFGSTSARGVLLTDPTPPMEPSPAPTGRNTWIVFVLVVILAIVLIVYLGGNDDTDGTTADTSAPGTTTATTAVATTAAPTTVATTAAG